MLTWWLSLSLAAAAPPMSTVLVGFADQDPVAAEVRQALSAQLNVTLQEAAVTTRLIGAAQTLGVGCDIAFDECLLQVASICGVARVMAGQMAGGRLTLRLASADGSVIRATVLRTDVPVQLRQVQVQEAIAFLVEPAHTATLVVEAPSGAAVAVDGLERGRAPLAAITGMGNGIHTVAVQFVDGAREERAVVLRLGRRSRVILEERPVTAHVAVWGGGIGLTAGLGALALGAGLAIHHALQQAGLAAVERAYRADAGADLNDAATRARVIAAQESLGLLPAYAPAATIGGAVSAVLGATSLLIGTSWTDLFGAPVEELPL